MASVMTAESAVGRDGELEELRGFLRGVGGGAGALVLVGEPGIGKTILWEAGVEEATALGHRVLVHRAVEAEAGLAFTGLADLVAPVLVEVMPALAPPRRRALRVALLLDDPGDDPPDPRAIGLAFLDAMRRLAADGPVVLAIDDLQWLDSSSATILPLALRRLRGEAVAVVATLRDAPDVRAPFELARVFGQERTRNVSLDALRLGELHRLLTDRLDLELSRPELVRVLEISGGNPFFALELGRELARSATRHLVGGAIRVPASLREALDGRLARLPGQTVDVLLVASALARPTVELTVAASGEREGSLDALDAAAREGVVQLDGQDLRFTHPLLASLCYEQAPPWRRRAVHERLATAVTDVEQRARHLALATVGAGAGLAAALDAAAEHAAARGATAAAAELAELAAQRTPPESPAEQRRRRQVAAARFHQFAGDFGRACELYGSLAEELPAGLERADVLYARAVVGRDDLPTRVRLCEQALSEASGGDARSAQILGFLAMTRWLLGDVPAALRDARAGLARAERLGDARALAVALGRVGLMETWALDITPGLLERGVAIERTLDNPLMFVDSPAFILAIRLYETDALDRSRAMLEGMERAAVERGDEHTRQFAVMQLIIVEWYAGRWHRALEYAAVACELAEQTQEPQYGAVIRRLSSTVEADVGLVEQARRSAEEGLRLARSISDEINTIGNLAALGHLELVIGDLRAAGGYLRDLPERQLRTGYRSTRGSPWSDTIETLIGLGELERARAYLSRFQEIAAASNRWARVGAARCAGLLAAAEGDTAGALQAFMRALGEDEPPMYPFERARTLLALGAVRRQALQRRAARETLEQALAMFERLGARPWAEKTREELGRISGRRAPSEELTDAERRIAELAAQGRHNKEIAAALFIGVGTVEAHLSRVYRKLGVRSRTELAGSFAKQRDDAPKL
jgi:DNA-binding CsgD family transcriptional regulator